MDRLADLIKMAQGMLDGGFDPECFLTWKTLSFLCLMSLLGPLHFYTRKFGRVTRKMTSESVLAGEGILEAAKANITEAPVRREFDGKIEPPAEKIRFTPWLSRKKQWYPLHVFAARPRA